mmetsp:Transcript_20777/g.23124  ORF Transcript_20777/g.23124 Transcript_20777/m.23124 type:complete len:326 (+) Transcript_20777:200-1177(+)
MHSLADSGVFFVLHGAELSPAFYLVNNGYDVWLINIRGTSMSLQHETLDWELDREYWDFNWAGVTNDLQATIQYIIDNTNFDRVGVVTGSLTTPAFFIGTSTDPEWYNERVSVGIALGPVIHIESSPTLNANFMCHNPFLPDMLSNFGITYVYPPRGTPIGDIYQGTLNMVGAIMPTLHNLFISTSLIEDPKTYDPSTFANTASHVNEPVSTQIISHVFQNCRNGVFNYYDYGTERNLEEYGTETAPAIPLEDITIPMALFTATADGLDSVENDEWLEERLAGSLVFQQDYDMIGRDGFIAGSDMSYLTDVLELLNTYSPELESS